MLTITRKKGEKILISLPSGETIQIILRSTSSSGATFLFDAPKTINIAREEIFDSLMLKKTIEQNKELPQRPLKPKSTDEPFLRHMAIVDSTQQIFELQRKGYFRIIHVSEFYRDIIGLNADSINFFFIPDEDQLSVAKLRVMSKLGKVLINGQVIYDYKLILKEFSNKKQ